MFNNKMKIYILTIPALIVLCIFFIYPIALSVKMSFTDFTGVGIANNIGFDNYERIFSRQRYFDAILTTLKFSMIVVVVQNLLGLFFASMLHRLPAIRNFSRAALFTPAMMSFVIVGYVWQFIYSPYNGGLNALLGSIGLESFQRAWLGDPSTALFAITAAHIWMFAGYSCAIYLAGYANIPDDIQEAARLDGAKSWDRFRYMELPLLAPTITINVILATIGTLKTFELPFIMTQGGPAGATRTLSLEIMNNLFGSYKFGFASSLSIVMLIVMIMVVFFMNRFLRKREEQA
ncbi:MAG: raffinose/stachyose/melibiose transport system permease protein [Psychromonas sp.]|jgi:raffinose/stachyose/melibiose transport system permease protein|uniref:carbohydrate ABC transporter permease n=1 Tax=Psychromonas sp. TaxID=1884585 RepID=UPI0039E53960